MAKYIIVSTEVTKSFYGDNEEMREMIGEIVTLKHSNKKKGSFDYNGFIWRYEDTKQLKLKKPPEPVLFNPSNIMKG